MLSLIRNSDFNLITSFPVHLRNRVFQASLDNSVHKTYRGTRCLFRKRVAQLTTNPQREGKYGRENPYSNHFYPENQEALT